MNRFERFSYSIFEISRLWHRLADEELSKVGLKGAYATYLTTLFKNPNGITSAELSKKCAKDKADTSRAVKLFEKKGIITKSEESYRAKLFLTEEGKKISENINNRAKKAVDIAGSNLSNNEREIMYKSLESILENLQKLSKEGIPTE